ncbi:hypothetical protein Celaphus_00018879 [Cervus elaphus hippelaphus]|uniref:Uncharacterized protein n=1 Tax=Cervus elaphus hippelaphus TaxID=46360 RepID=A0A212C5R7_CEREH|nr:hypothetical protein Celaphus_00018879 [Cervus elaphus hippelaphus]
MKLNSRAEPVEGLQKGKNESDSIQVWWKYEMFSSLYKDLACEMGFEEFHLYLRPVHFESASHKDKVVDPPPVFITSLLEDSDCVDRYSPATLVLAISEVDDNQIGKFSFYTKEAILKDEIGKVKRDVIVEYCQKFNRHMSHYALRGQIIAYCNSLRALLDDFPTIRDTFFMVGQRQEKKGLRDSDDGLKNDPRWSESLPAKVEQVGTEEL